MLVLHRLKWIEFISKIMCVTYQNQESENVPWLISVRGKILQPQWPILWFVLYFFFLAYVCNKDSDIYFSTGAVVMKELWTALAGYVGNVACSSDDKTKAGLSLFPN